MQSPTPYSSLVSPNPYSSLVPGDLVRCVDPGEFELTKGKLYTVKRTEWDGREGWLIITGNDVMNDRVGGYGYRASRFEAHPVHLTMGDAAEYEEIIAAQEAYEGLK